MPDITVTKLDVTRRQLESAVRLYFNDADSVSIHTLACAAHEVLAALNERKGNPPAIVGDNLVKDEYKKEFREMIAKAKNFFKHADRDPEGVLEFNPSVNEVFLFDACEMYQRLTGEKLAPFIAYRGWFSAMRPSVLNFPSNDIIREKYKTNKLGYYSDMLAAAGLIRGS